MRSAISSARANVGSMASLSGAEYQSAWPNAMRSRISCIRTRLGVRQSLFHAAAGDRHLEQLEPQRHRRDRQRHADRGVTGGGERPFERDMNLIGTTAKRGQICVGWL